jgi:hypothetical protein
MKQGLKLEALGLGAQALSFAVGLVLSLLFGMLLAAHLDGPGGLLVATLLSGAGLLGSAVGSQSLRDWLVQRDSDQK